MTTLSTDDHLRDARELPGKPRAIVVTVNGCVVEQDENDVTRWVVHKGGAKYRVVLYGGEIRAKGLDLALYDAVGEVPQRGYVVP